MMSTVILAQINPPPPSCNPPQLSCCPTPGACGPNCPTCNPIPINNELIVLLIGGIIFGAYTIKKRNLLK